MLIINLRLNVTISIWRSKMADKIFKNQAIYVEFCTRGFFGSLIMNPNLHFLNFRIQNGDFKMADENFEYDPPIHDKRCKRGLFGSLFINL